MILKAVAQFAPEHAKRLKKADIASEAERPVDGAGWMPAMFNDKDLEGKEQDERDLAGRMTTKTQRVRRMQLQ